MQPIFYMCWKFPPLLKPRIYGISFSRKEMVQMSILSPRTNPVFKLIPVYW
ncbi:hypothetical protein CUMW_288420 [Citrus unshiu]|uniref:Uncharacterized protein n=1 Tax=Citrus unshiu TaxID=55188 RepID=A0A2H5QY34_CITUN|nr:hypothetical protein CUMW_288420 [Citrus unshiu]